MPEPATSVTPPARNVRPKKSRLINGICFTYSLVMSVPSVAFCVSSSGAVVVTSTFSLTLAGLRVKLSVASWSTASTTPVRSSARKPGI